MRVLVTGGKGMLGTDLSRILKGQSHEVVITDIQEMDVRDISIVMKIAENIRPELVVHLAALTDVDASEGDPDGAFHTNTIGTQNVALACQKYGAEMVYVSTLSVFNGEKKEAYTEFDSPDPRSWYSQSKYQGELIVERLLDRYYIVRAGWMFGGGGEDKKFVAKIMDLARKRSQLKVVNDKFGSPTYTVDLSRGIMSLVEARLYGRYHMVNTGIPVSRFEVAQSILAYANLQTCKLLPVSSAEFPLAAHRPRMEGGRNLLLELRGLNWMRPWAQALEEYITGTLL
jgi:dTDP-4-dehydrorhamnose reductase